ncbi:MAG: DNA polymerase IV [Candidatus Omnitrophica bacterium]|nr:DNA polymerase IV [Candidatus Omnitrophota bacterium]
MYNTLMTQENRYIVHVDMDAFFTSVEQRDDPSLKGRPVIVGSDPKGGTGRGVVAACSYEARKFGIHSAMPISIAYKKCPNAVFLTGSMRKYSIASKTVFRTLEKFSPDIEPISIDEAFIDITGSWRLFADSPTRVCRMIKDEIKKATGLTASVGMAPNMMTAKIASDIDKPDGLTVVDEKGLLSFLGPLPIEKLWGVGEKSARRLHGMNIRTIGDIAQTGVEELARVFGENGRHLWELANGIDHRKVETSDETKSVGNESTFEEDVRDKDVILKELMYLSEKVSRRLRKAGLKGRTVTLKIRFSDFSTFTRAESLAIPTNFTDELYSLSLKNLDKFTLSGKAVRLVGVRVTNLTASLEKHDLFDGVDPGSQKKERIHKAIDKIKDRFGDGAVHRGSA